MTTMIEQVYPNGHIRTLTVISAIAGDIPETAIMMTSEEGAIAVSLADAPDIWAQLVTAGVL